MPPIVPSKMPLITYIAVALTPKVPRNIATATSFTRGEVIRKENVTPKGSPPFTNPMNRGIDEQEQKGVTVPRRAAMMFAHIPLNLPIIFLVLSGGK